MAKRTAEKLILITLGGPIADEMLRLAREGRMPNLSALMKRGVYAENCLAPYPTATLPNCAAIATGAWPGTHGLCSNGPDPRTDASSGPTTPPLKAIPLWDAAAAAGKRSILINCPLSWSAEPPGGVRLGGTGPSINDWRLNEASETGYSLCSAQLFTTREISGARLIQPRPARGWKNLQTNQELEFEAHLYWPNARQKPKAPAVIYGLLHAGPDGYQDLSLHLTRDAKAPLASLRKGKWSGKIVTQFSLGEEKLNAGFLAKLLDLSPSGDTVQLLLTPIAALQGWAWPGEIENELADVSGLPLPASPFRPLLQGWIDSQTSLDMLRMIHTWYAEAACRLMDTRNWDLFLMHDHTPEWVSHALLDLVEPTSAEHPDGVPHYRELLAGAYESLDQAIGRILENADRRTLIAVASTHGAIPRGREVDVTEVLAEAGLLSLRDDGKIDWHKTRAAPFGMAHVLVNLEGRERHGIVAPNEYEDVREQIINTLLDYNHPVTGKHPFAFALRREDARPLGLYGPQVGDVIFSLAPEYGLQHGYHLTTASRGIGSVRPLLIMAGPNVKKNVEIERSVWLTDIAPTLCYLMDIPYPETMEGAIIYQALQDPTLTLTQKAKLHANYQRLKRAYDAEVALTHTYNR